MKISILSQSRSGTFTVLKHAALLFGLLALTSCGAHLPFGKNRYRVNGSENVTLGAIGYKNTTGGNSFDSYSLPDLQGVPVVQAAERYQKVESDKKLEAKLSAAYAVANGSVTANRVRMSLEAGKYRVFTILEKDKLITRLNALDAVKTQPLRERQGRLITSIVIVYDHESSDDKTLSGEIEAAVSAELIGAKENPSLKLTFSNGKKTTVKLKDGSLIAYEYARAIWSKDAPGKIIALKPDKIGWDR